MKQRITAIALACAFAPLAHGQSTEQKIETLQQELDRLKRDVSGLRKDSATSLFGYGEFNYNRFRDAERTSKADVRRFVIGFGHRFNDRLSFNSEVELEHAVASAEDRGEIEIEQAYLNYQFSDALNVKGGLFLIPLGILNLTHEPPTYYGVERNEVETRIIPTTWRELGVGLHGLLGGHGLRYDVGVTTGFNTGKLDDPNTGIGSGHQEGAQADARDLSVYGALNYQRPGLLAGGGVFTGNTGQNGQANAALRGVPARLTLWDLHVKYSVARWDLQALYARGTLGDAERVNGGDFNGRDTVRGTEIDERLVRPGGLSRVPAGRARYRAVRARRTRRHPPTGRYGLGPIPGPEQSRAHSHVRRQLLRTSAGRHQGGHPALQHRPQQGPAEPGLGLHVLMARFDPALWIPVAAACVPAVAHATQYLTLEQAQRVLFPAAERFSPATVRLSAEARARVAAESGVPSRKDEQAVWRAMRGDALLGFFVVDDVIGKHELITYAVAIDPEGVVRGVEILDYREPRGGEVRDARWRAQFLGKRTTDSLRLGEDIQNLSGATLSCRHITEGVRRLVVLHRVALKGQ
jgi:hypothetical protein